METHPAAFLEGCLGGGGLMEGAGVGVGMAEGACGSGSGLTSCFTGWMQRANSPASVKDMPSAQPRSSS